MRGTGSKTVRQYNSTVIRKVEFLEMARYFCNDSISVVAPPQAMTTFSRCFALVGRAVAIRRRYVARLPSTMLVSHGKAGYGRVIRYYKDKCSVWSNSPRGVLRLSCGDSTCKIEQST